MNELAKKYQNDPESFEPDNLGGLPVKNNKKNKININKIEGDNVVSDSKGGSGKERRVERRMVNNIKISGSPASEDAIEALKQNLSGESEVNEAVKEETVAVTEGKPVVPEGKKQKQKKQHHQRQ